MQDYNIDNTCHIVGEVNQIKSHSETPENLGVTFPTLKENI